MSSTVSGGSSDVVANGSSSSVVGNGGGHVLPTAFRDDSYAFVKAITATSRKKNQGDVDAGTHVTGRGGGHREEELRPFPLSCGGGGAGTRRRCCVLWRTYWSFCVHLCSVR